MGVLLDYLLLVLCIIIGIGAFIILNFNRNKYYFMPFSASSPEYYYPEWNAENGVEINYSAISHNNLEHQNYKLCGFISNPVFSVTLNDIIILYFHGNAGNIYLRIPKYLEMVEHLDKHNDTHRHVLVSFDYRGFGCSNGVPSVEGILEDGLQMVNWCREKFPKNKIIYYGESIGTSVVAYISQYNLKQYNQNPIGIILKSPFASMSSLVADMFNLPYWIPEYIIPNDFRTFEWLDNVDKNIPILIMHNKNDLLIPTRNIKPLLDKYISITLEGGHNDCEINTTWLNGFKHVIDNK